MPERQKINPELLTIADKFYAKMLSIANFYIISAYPYPLIPPYDVGFSLPVMFSENKKVVVIEETPKLERFPNRHSPTIFISNDTNAAARVYFQDDNLPPSPTLQVFIRKTNKKEVGILMQNNTDREIFFPEEVYISERLVEKVTVCACAYGRMYSVAFDWSEMIAGEAPFRPAIGIVIPATKPQKTALCLVPKELYEHYQKLRNDIK